MENVKETIAKNLMELRKAHKMTQSALAEKLNYSDKAISRWEHAETLPDIETLCRICDIYGVSFEYLLSKDAKESDYPSKKKENLGRHIIMCLISVCTVWLAALVVFTSLGALCDRYIWQIFIWAIPFSGGAIAVCNAKWWKSKICAAIISSVNTWGIILSIYLQLIDHNLWLLFIVGAPIQAIIILAATMPKKRVR